MRKIKQRNRFKRRNVGGGKPLPTPSPDEAIAFVMRQRAFCRDRVRAYRKREAMLKHTAEPEFTTDMLAAGMAELDGYNPATCNAREFVKAIFTAMLKAVR